MKRQTDQPTIFDRNGFFSRSFLEWISKQRNSMLFETTLPDLHNWKNYVFLKPVSIIKANALDKVERSLKEIDSALQDGYYVAGFISYEAGAAFEKVLSRDARLYQPLGWFGIYEKPLVYNHRTKRIEQGREFQKKIVRQLADAYTAEASYIIPKPSVEYAEYEKGVAKVQDYIRAGDTYQVNYTFKMKFPWRDSAAALYAGLRTAQRVGYSAFLLLREYKILSFSPELFLRLDGNSITVKPMKGTAPRGRTLEEDRVLKEDLRASEKNRAENLMIVDMLRNDLGRIAKTGSVRVASFFDIERYDTVFQATSTVQAQVRSGTTASEIIKNLFPCGSVTGAPKIRTMQIIRELEREPRGIYTGSLGFFAPKKKAIWNVAIRTVVLNTRECTGEMGVGSGIVHDSNTEGEYQECLLKGKFLAEAQSVTFGDELELLETLRWEPRKGYLLLKNHLRRLERSAEYFGFAFRRPSVLSFLKKHEALLRKAGKRKLSFRVRLTMRRDGAIAATHFRLEEQSGLQHVRISEKKVDSRDRFLFHKTTNRAQYDQELERAMLDGYFDLLFLNEREELTEGARSNLFVKKNGRFFTPPVACGLLPGTYREYLLHSKRYAAEEKIMTLDDLHSADEIYLCNAVRGLVKVLIEETR